ncbi:hypothetical protein ACFLXN_01940 [Chloroflexota bacterium]
MQAKLVITNDDGEVREVELEDRGESKRYYKFGIGQFGQEDTSSDIVTTVYIDKEI